MLIVPSASAHPLGNFTVNLYSGISLSRGVVKVDYVLEMAEISTQEQKPGMDLDADGEISAEERQGWADRAAAQLLTNLHLVVNGQPVTLSLIDDSLTFRTGQAGLDLLYLQATYEGELSAAGLGEYRDDNFRGRPGWREITVATDPPVVLLRSSVPDSTVSNALRDYPPGAVDTALDVNEALFSFRSADAPVDGSTPPPSPGEGNDSGSPAGPASGFTALLASTTDRALIPILALAFGFGFVHALGPGHGKVVIAASGASRSIRIRHAVTIGGVVAAMHCATSIGLGLIAIGASEVLSSEETYSILRLVSAVAVLVIGAILLVVRLRQRATIGDNHDHQRARNRSTASNRDAVDRVSLGAIAASGGLVPSPSAVVVMLGAVAAGRIPIGVALVIVFSLGLASALVMIGVMSVYAGGLAYRLQFRAARWLPIASAVVILVVGGALTATAIGSMA
jgi:ABC-type nickel/cobalt efflux system permease component RcnA